MEQDNPPPKKTNCPTHVWEAIHGKSKESKSKQLEKSLTNWWKEYADRKNDEEDEHVADSLLYDRNHLPRTAPAPDCVQRQLSDAQQQMCQK